jgi:hypothetical protein
MDGREKPHPPSSSPDGEGEKSGDSPARKAYRAHVEIGTLGRFNASRAVPIRDLPPDASKRDKRPPSPPVDEDWLAPNFADDPADDESDDTPQPFWTRRRVLYLILALIIVITLLAESFSGFFQPPTPPPPLPPMPMI